MLNTMYDLKFKDYIKKYKNINKEEWITLYQRKKENDIESNVKNDIFTFCAMIDVPDIKETNYLKDFSWGFTPYSFGTIDFGTQGFGSEESIVYYDGTTYNEFEYLVALRSFQNYDDSVELNPKLIWYGNLAKNGDDYVDPNTDEDIIHYKTDHISVKRKYLKDFLAAEKKACVIAFDHRRYFTLTEEEIKEHEDYNGENYFFSFTKTASFEVPEGFNAFSLLIGKTLIMPFPQPRHNYFKSLTEDKEYENFIIGYDEDEDTNIEYTCKECCLSNFFSINTGRPGYLTPVYFKADVLNKYKDDARHYTINDDMISYMDEWTLVFGYNEDNTVFVWLGDLGKLPYEEQKYWKSFNITPTGKLEKKIVQRQLGAIFTDASRIETKLLALIRHFNNFIKEKYGDIMFVELGEADKEIYNTFVIPTNHSLPEYQNFLMKLSKLTAESINKDLINKTMATAYAEENKQVGSIQQLGKFLKHEKIDQEEKIAHSIRKAYNARNKLAGHKGSLKQYNALWGRKENDKFNSIEDARNLLRDIVAAFTYVLGNYEAKNSETT